MKNTQITSSLLESSLRDTFRFLGENPDREGLKDSPSRIVKSWQELFGGYNVKVEDILTVFDSEGFDQMVTLTDIEFYSTCEHHMLPFFGKAHIGYIPNGKIIGLSKLARIVDIFARRFQNQERLTQQIVEAIQTALSPKGVVAVLEAKHFCMVSRGVNKQSSIMRTSKVSGVFEDNNSLARAEFFSLLKNGH